MERELKQLKLPPKKGEYTMLKAYASGGGSGSRRTTATNRPTIIQRIANTARNIGRRMTGGNRRGR